MPDKPASARHGAEQSVRQGPPIADAGKGEEGGGLLLRTPALRDVETPALVIDLAALDRNIAAMAAKAKRAGISLRPHAKTHKSTDIAALQLRAGAAGIACATVAEAEMLAAQGIGGILLTAPQMGGAKCAAIARLNRDGRHHRCRRPWQAG